jgi:hypothetical protein
MWHGTAALFDDVPSACRGKYMSHPEPRSLKLRYDVRTALLGTPFASDEAVLTTPGAKRLALAVAVGVLFEMDSGANTPASARRSQRP